LAAARAEELQANFAGISHRTLQGFPPSIDPDCPPKNFKDAMSRDDKQEWAEAYNKEYQGFKERNAFKVVRPDKGIRIHDTLTRLEYKEDNGTFLKRKHRKLRLCARGDQHDSADWRRQFQILRHLCPHSKGSRSKTVGSNRRNTPARYWRPIRGRHSYGEMGEDEKVYIRPSDWWPEPIPEGHVLLLLKSMYGTKQAALLWHMRISEWMEQHGYPASGQRWILSLNTEKTIFMKREGADFIIHWLFVDDMMHVLTCGKLRNQFLELYKKELEIRGGGLMETFLENCTFFWNFLRSEIF
jgi:hypothetical protein